MKVKLGELNGKPIVSTDAVDTITFNEILYAEGSRGIILKERNDSGELVDISDSENPIYITDTYDVSIVSTNIIKGPDKWAKNTSYLFYVSTGESFKITNDITSEDMTSNANLVATDTIDSVYEIQAAHCAPITIEEV